MDVQRLGAACLAPAGIVFVVALLAETAISAGLPINQNDSATKIASQLQEHRHTGRAGRRVRLSGLRRGLS